MSGLIFVVVATSVVAIICAYFIRKNTSAAAATAAAATIAELLKAKEIADAANRRCDALAAELAADRNERAAQKEREASLVAEHEVLRATRLAAREQAVIDKAAAREQADIAKGLEREQAAIAKATAREQADIAKGLERFQRLCKHGADCPYQEVEGQVVARCRVCPYNHDRDAHEAAAQSQIDTYTLEHTAQLLRVTNDLQVEAGKLDAFNEFGVKILERRGELAAAKGENHMNDVRLRHSTQWCNDGIDCKFRKGNDYGYAETCNMMGHDRPPRDFRRGGGASGGSASGGGAADARWKQNASREP